MYLAQPSFVKIYAYIHIMHNLGKSSRKMWAASVFHHNLSNREQGFKVKPLGIKVKSQGLNAQPQSVQISPLRFKVHP
jgi:hypothetical protein